MFLHRKMLPSRKEHDMDLRSRLALIDRRLYTLETVSRLRSAAISEGTTEFSGEGQLSIEDGGSFIIDNGGAMGGGSWEIGTNEDGTTYANVGDVLLYTHEAEPVSRYTTIESLPVPVIEPITKVVQETPEGSLYSVVVGTLTVMAETDTRVILRVRSKDLDISLVVLEGQTQSVPLMMKFEGTIEFEIHATNSYDIDSHFEVITQWEVEDGEE